MLLWIAAAVTRVDLPEIQTVTITAGKNGTHMEGSKHGIYAALDLRSKDMPSLVVKRRFMSLLRRELGPDYDVILEKLGTVNEHVHVEHDPK